MSYIASWSLTFENVPDKEKELQIIAELREASIDAKYCITEYGNTKTSGSWYEFRKEIAALSLNYPLVIFQIEGWGEEKKDYYRTYIQNGYVHDVRAEFTFAPFDPNMSILP